MAAFASSCRFAAAVVSRHGRRLSLRPTVLLRTSPCPPCRRP
ncbi:unnamed protein product [Aureobasidium pullulans]|nr:unnamed protein product [Aureobasidium pullulans]